MNPIAVFEPVELEGTTVSRASVHNVSIMRELELGVGDEIEVYKANMIIPQIADNLTRSGVRDIPEHCPACGGDTRISERDGVETLYCANPGCPAKAMKAFTLFVSRDAMNIEGMSEATLEKFMAHGLIRDFSDIFLLNRHREEIMEMDGFGEKSYDKLWQAIEKARSATLSRMIYALGIPGIGLANAKMICRAFASDPEKVRGASMEELDEIDGIGEVLARGYVEWWQDEKHQQEFDRLLQQVTLQREQEEGGEKFKGKTFVVTGSLEHFANRSALKDAIEKQGGKVTGSVTGKTDYLINNNRESSSSKNKKARELGIPVITEKDFLDMLDDRMNL